ncbi:hypothetical protein BGX31_010371 [Mortierella sp. GBA43]|nr:hypothetical protein BGX31_010371 [Mortierella sp. GBA43]
MADPGIALVLCHDAEVSLSQVKRAAKYNADKTIHNEIATVYIGLGDFLESRGHQEEAKAFYKKSEKWGGRPYDPDRPGRSIRPTITRIPPRPLSVRTQESDAATLSQEIFLMNVCPPAVDFKPPEPDTGLSDTPQLAHCLALLHTDLDLDDILNSAARKWLKTTRDDPDEQERLNTLATYVIRAFKRDELKDAKAVAEVMYLAPVLENDDYRYLLKEFYSGIDQSGLLDIHQLEGLAQVVQSAQNGYLDSDDLVKVLALLSKRLRDTHRQSTDHTYQLTLAVSHVLDAMADANVKGLDREKLHEPLSLYLDKLKKSSDPYLLYQAAYAFQALLCVPDNESIWKATLRRTGKVLQGVAGLVSAVKSLDLNGFIEGLRNIQQGLAGASDMVQIVKTACDGVTSLASNGERFLECLKEGFSFSRKCAWYPALRGADILIRDGQFADFRRLVCEAPCRRDVAFQWGVCQRLGEIAASPKWNVETRHDAIAFLEEIYRNDADWGEQPNIRQWILTIFMHLSSESGDELYYVKQLVQDLQKDGDATTQTMHQACCENAHGYHLLEIALPPIGSPSLLDRVQERPDVEKNIRQLRRQRLKERKDNVYIPPQAKASAQARDESRFPLMERVKEYLDSDQKVFLLLGDSGAGKSTFNKELEWSLWESYKKKTGPIPLNISLPAIDKPEHDLIAKQLRIAEFTEPQIRELKLHRKFILICDGYDESQQTHNLYASNRLNVPGEWNAQMVISCRSEYLGVDYRDRFQPVDRNNRSESTLFQEAVIAPFTSSQVHNYITQYVALHRPLWEAAEYEKALELIPSLKELVRNPFLMSLSLDVLPRIVDPGQDLTLTSITRVALYDKFIEHWLERGKKRIGEKNLSPQSRAAFESLIDEGFTRNGIDYLKKLSVAIYKEQGGQPIVGYSRYKDENTWKAGFFSRDDEKQLLREACPLIRSGNQHRFIHRSLLEYGLALAIFDPEDWKERIAESTLARRGSVHSVSSDDEDDPVEDVSLTVRREPDSRSPLVWRSFVRETPVLQFLEERVQQEPLFKMQLRDYIELSKIDKKWCTAASNAITLLVRAGVQFNCANLQGVRIRKADLSYGMFDSAQFQGADLRDVDFRGSWLRQADLSGAIMTDVQFGELPFLKQESEVKLSVYSPDGKFLAVGLANGRINVYSTSAWNKERTLKGHSRDVSSIVYSPNGRQFASGGQDSKVRIWDVETGACIHTLIGHAKSITNVIYSPQGNRIASASQDSTIRLWSVKTGKCLHVLSGHIGHVFDVKYSPTGNQLASCGPDSTVRLWSTATGECLHTLKGHGVSINTVEYSPLGDVIASASIDKSVLLWDVETGNCRHTFAGHREPINSIKFSPKGDQVASASADFTIRLWDMESGVCLHTLRDHDGWIRSIAYSPHGDTIASTSSDKTVRMWDTKTGVCRQTLIGHTDSVSDVSFSPNHDHIASSSEDMTVRLWDVEAGLSRHISACREGRVPRITHSPKKHQVASCGRDGTIRLLKVETGELIHTLRGHRGPVDRAVYSPQGGRIATGSRDKTVRLWNSETGACIHTLTGHGNNVKIVAFSPQGNMVASGSDDRTVRIWDVKTGECRYNFRSRTESIIHLVFSLNSDRIVTRGFDGSIRLWDIETGVCKRTLTGHSREYYGLTYLQQNGRMASTNDGSTVQVWDVESGECHRVLNGHRTYVYSITYSPQGHHIASGSKDGTVYLWDVETGACLHTLSGHTAPAKRISFSPKGDLLASSCHDKSVRLWDVATGQCVAVIQDFRGCVFSITWINHDDIPHLAFGCEDGSVKMWRVLNQEGRYQVSLYWSSSPISDALDVTDTNIQAVQGLSERNKQLLKQRGAVGLPAYRMLQRKSTAMSCASSKLEAITDRMPESMLLTTHAFMERMELFERQMEQRVEQVVSAMIRDARESP